MLQLAIYLKMKEEQAYGKQKAELQKNSREQN